MKILHINTFNTGGAANSCLRLHQALLLAGIESKVLLRNKTSEKIAEVYEIWDQFNYVRKGQQLLRQKKYDRKNAEVLSQFAPVDELFSFPESIWDLTRHPLFEWADIIHLHWVAGFLDYPSFFETCKKKIVWTLHDEEPFSGGFHYPPSVDASGFTGLIEKSLHIKEAALKGQTIQVVTPSEYLSEESKKSRLFARFDHQVIRYCLDDQVFHYRAKEAARKALDLSTDKQMILFVSDALDYPRKGFASLKKAMELLDNEEVVLCAIGQTDQRESRENVIYLGHVSSEETIAEVYAAADVLVVPSVIDNLPNTVLEAHCCGTPVIGFNSGGIPEMIQPTNGIVCEPNAQALAAAIKSGLETSWNREEISQLAHEAYAQERCASTYRNLYAKLLSEPV